MVQGSTMRGEEDQILRTPTQRAWSSDTTTMESLQQPGANKTQQPRRRGLADDDPTCRLCKSTFKSMKSLYGHMRSHQRTWKGINPPPDEREPAPEMTTRDEIFTNFPKRSRFAKVLDRVRAERETSVIRWAARHLLALGGCRGCTKVEEDLSDDPAGGDGKMIATSVHVAGVNDVATVRVVEADQKVDPVNSVPKQYKCIVCNQSFSSRHAYDLHALSHKEFKKSSKETHRQQQQQQRRRHRQQQQQIQAAPGEFLHKCDQCPKSFRTGQALGGHKRKHYVKETEQAEKASEPVNAATQPKKELDLNLPATCKLEEN